MRTDVENYGGHFAMVENFVEKYNPIRIQSILSETLHAILSQQELERLTKFEKKKFNEMH